MASEYIIHYSSVIVSSSLASLKNELGVGTEFNFWQLLAYLIPTIIIIVLATLAIGVLTSRGSIRQLVKDNYARIMGTTGRPISVTIMSWLLIVASVLMLIAVLPGLTTQFWNLPICAIYIASGIAMLKGRNWGRLLYLFFVPIFFIAKWLLSGFHFRASIIVYIIYLVLLTRPGVSAFFSNKSLSKSKSEE